MRKFLVLAAIVSGLVMASGSAYAVWYMVNGRAATYAEIRFLKANGAPSGSYWVDAKGNIVRAGPSGYSRR
jgi:hypothetical protein